MCLISTDLLSTYFDKYLRDFINFGTKKNLNSHVNYTFSMIYT